MAIGLPTHFFPTAEIISAGPGTRVPAAETITSPGVSDPLVRRGLPGRTGTNPARPPAPTALVRKEPDQGPTADSFGWLTDSGVASSWVGNAAGTVDRDCEAKPALPGPERTKRVNPHHLSIGI